MGTILLPPRDCLSSPYDSQKSYLSSTSSEIGRRCSQSVMVPSPASQDCSRRSHSGGSHPGDGLLPIPPLIPGQMRVSSKRSPPSKLSSTTPMLDTLPQRIRQEPSPSRRKPKLLRSASAILLTPSVGSPPLAEGLLKGRLPFKLVQGNGPGTNNPHVQGVTLKKLNNQRYGVCKTNSHTLNLNMEEKPEKSKIQDGAGFAGYAKETSVRISMSLEKRNSGKGSREKAQVKGDVPIVTILQRPKTEEAAMELFAKFFQNAHQLTNEGMEAVSEESEKLPVMVIKSKLESKWADEEPSEAENGDVNSPKTAATLPLKSLKKDCIKSFNVADAGDVNSPKLRACLEGGHYHGSKTLVLEAGCHELAPWERWAGPSYINSPPPSALPLPRFSMKLSKVAAADSACVKQMEGMTFDPMPTSPLSISPLYTSLARQQYLTINSDAVATATKDLKRILNLDLCRL